MVTSIVLLIYKCVRNRSKCTKSLACFGVFLQIFFGVMMTLSTSSYYVGDNLVTFVTEYKDLNCHPTHTNSTEAKTCGKRATMSAIYMLIFGAIGFRFIPLLEKKATILLNLMPQSNATNNNEEDKNHFYTTIIESFAMITELDAWYTAIITVAKYNAFKFTCSKDVTTSFWIAFVLVMIGLGAYLALTCAINYFKKEDKKEDCCIYVAMCVSILFVWIISAFYILGDNKQPLDCYNSQNNMNRVHLSFVCVSLTVYIVILIVNLIALYWKRKSEDQNESTSSFQNEDEGNQDIQNHDESTLSFQNYDQNQRKLRRQTSLPSCLNHNKPNNLQRHRSWDSLILRKSQKELVQISEEEKLLTPNENSSDED